MRQKFINKTNPFISIILFLLILTIGILIRTNNISPFKIYPDAYQNLLVSENIQNHGRVIGTLGKNGMEYPDFIAWTRPVYSLMIYLAHQIIPDQAFAARIIALINGILTIPLSYLLTKQIFQSKLAGFIAALLLALSFNHVVWGGFILTETTGVLFVALFLWSLLKNIHQKSQYANPIDLLTGLLFGIAIFTRYEYLILFLPVTYLICKLNSTPVYKLINIYSTTIFVSSIFITQLFPIRLLTSKIVTEAKTNLIILLYISLISILCFIYTSKKSKINLPGLTHFNFNHLSILVFWSFILLLIAQMLGFTFLAIHTAAIRDFIRDDIAISVLSIIGLTLLLRKKQYQQYANFILFSILLLWLNYDYINSEMERYWTHMIPFLLIPASYTITVLLENNPQKSKLKLLFSLFTIILLVYQTIITRDGIKKWGEGAWYGKNYEEEIAKMIQTKYIQKQDTLLTSFPEPYYYITKQSTISLTDHAPFIYVGNNYQKNLLIIQDMGMYEVFPNFSKFIQKNLRQYEITRFHTNNIYHYGPIYKKENKPVIIYRIPAQELINTVRRITN